MTAYTLSANANIDALVGRTGGDTVALAAGRRNTQRRTH